MRSGSSTLIIYKCHMIAGEVVFQSLTSSHA